MPRIPLAVVSTSSDDSGDSEGDLAGDFRTADWTVVHMASIESFPFSEVSHQPYGMDSTYLDSVSHGSAHLRMRNSSSNAQDMVALSPRVSPRSPRSLLPRGTSNYHQLTPTSMNSTHPRGANAALLGLGASGAGHATLSPIGRGIPGAPPLPHRNRKAKPNSRRTRSLQVGAPRWRDSDGDMELLVRREVSKNGPVSPVTTEDYAVLSIETSSAGTSPATTPPPLWVESPSKKDGVKAENGRQKNGEALTPTAPAALPQVRTLEATTAAAAAAGGAPSPQRRAPQVTDPAGKKKAAHATTAARMPLSGRRLSSPVVRGNNSSNSNSNSSTTAATTKPVTDARRQSLTHSDTTSYSSKATQKQAGAPNDALASSPPAASAASAQVGAAPPVAVSRVNTAAPPGPLKGKGIAGESVDRSTTKASPKAAGNGDRKGSGETAAARSPLAHRVQPLKDTAAPAAAAVVLLPPVSPSSATTATTTTIATTTAAAGERPPSAKPEERRRRPRRFSLQSSNTVDTTASSVESVVVKPQGRHPTLKPLVTSPDDTDPVLPSRATATQSPDVALSNSLPALSPKQLSSRAGDNESTPRRRLKRAQTMTPSVEVSPKRGAAQAEADVALAGSLNTFSTLLPPDSPPTLRPQTREFNEKAASPTGGGGAAAPSFVSPASRATAERLVTFVRAVSDPEVLHVIYDYLTEQQRSTPRFRLAATACAELLERKEELLKTQEEATPVESEVHGVRNSSGQQQHYPPPQDSDCFTLDVGQTTAVMGETSRAAEVRRLLAEIAAEQAETEGAATAEQNGDDGREEDPDVDEFDDFNYFDTPYPPQGHFSFGQPTVSGVVSRVFAEGMLFKIKTMDGNYHFYNDTLQDVMMVRVQCVLRGNETINERAMLAPVEESKETEITIAVLPEETNFFMSGVSHLPHFMAKRVPVPPDYASPSVTQSLRKINAEINAVRKALGKWSRASDQAAFLKCCLRHHLKFTDLTFRPCTESLYRRGCDAVTIPAVTWRRPEEYVYLPEVAQTRLFRGEISCFLVRQGELSNHTVVAAMAAIAQFPSHVRWLFRHPVSAAVGKMERAEGCYRVTLLHNGWWKTYVMDDYVPASLKGPLFASCPEDPRRLWVPLLEKAYAKSLGAYAATCVVDAMEAMGDFTGFPVRYLDTLWAAAKAKPTGPPCRTLFQYIQRAVKVGCTVLLFTPAASDAASKNTVTLSKLRSSRLLPVKGVTPQFLPGHIYFLNDVAYYEELDLRMAQLKNPWTWETRHRMHREKKWKYTTWYDRPDISMSAMGSALGSSGALSTGTANRRPVATNLGNSAGMTQAAQQLNERKGTMWVEWREVLAAFAGGGVCYTLWSYHRYRAKNAFVNGRPRFVLEMKARRKVEVFVTLSLETVSETLDSYGTVVASRPLPLCGTAMAVVRRLSRQSAHVVSESCEDVECVAGRRTYVVAKDVSTKLTIDPRVAEGTVLVVPLLDPQAAEDMALGSSTIGGGTAAEVRFVLSLVTEAVAGDGEDLSISFVSMRRSCGVFTDSAAPFDLESTSRVTASYQICTERGVKTLEGNRICDAESGSPPPS